MTALTEKERELVAVGTAIGAGCQPCTHHHVREALKVGLSPQEVEQAIEAAQGVRRVGGTVVANVGRRLLGVAAAAPSWHGRPADREQALVYVGAAAGCNAGSLLTEYLERSRELGVPPDELAAALEAAKVVKKAAAMFLDRDVERALTEMPAAPAGEGVEAPSCCGSACR